MKFDEAIPCMTMGNMVSNDSLTSSVSKSNSRCYTCGCKVSIYNPRKRCFPCRKKEVEIISNSIDSIFEGGQK